MLLNKHQVETGKTLTLALSLKEAVENRALRQIQWLLKVTRRSKIV